MTVRVFDTRACSLGEGPLWHPRRQQLFWFDILGKRLLTQEDGVQKHWQFDEQVSAAGWIDDDTLLIASETALSRFDISSGNSTVVIPLEADEPRTRSNDGRADPWGGFWIGTMGMEAEQGLASIHRFYRGALHRLYSSLSIPNGICFSPDRQYAFFSDTPTQKVMRQALDDEGWPVGGPETLIDLTKEDLNPDGAVVDRDGCIWIAQWAAARVARYTPDGSFLSAVDFPASQTTCPAFGGPALKTLFVTSAAIRVTEGSGGQTFASETGIGGQEEHQIIL